MADELGNSILNSPAIPPEKHFAVGPNGPTGEILPGRRSSESFIPIPASRKGKGDAEQIALDLDTTGERRERRERTTLTNDIRRQVEQWRGRNYTGVTPMSRKLLQHWAAGVDIRDDRMLFCQREAAETAIYLAEAAGRHGEPEPRTRIDVRSDLRHV